MKHARSDRASQPALRVLPGDCRKPKHSTSVLHGDAYDLGATLDAKSIDLVITSPPYWGHRSYGQQHDWRILDKWKAAGGCIEKLPPYAWYRDHGGVLGLEPVPEWYVAHLVEILGRIRPALKPRASMWINVGDTYFARWASIRENGRQGLGNNPRERRRTPMGGYRQEKQLLQIPARFSIGMQDDRWILRNDVIWFKPNVPPRPEHDRLRLAHEHFYHFVLRPKVGRAAYYYDMNDVEPGALDVVTHNVRAGRDGHSATFPVGLIRPRILSSCPADGVVLDPFCGTGSSLAVAAASGRRGIGFNLSSDFVRGTRSLLRDSSG